jgi:dTDP-4-amino-4,6-dideoxygalactose transaminase
LRNQGRDVFDAWLNHTRLGYNYRLDEMSAALGLTQLRRIDELLAKRERVARWYNERIGEIDGVEKPYIAPTTTRMSWFVYVLRCCDGVNRNELMAYLQGHGIPSRPYFTPIHLQPFYQKKFKWRRGDLPNTEKTGDAFLALPFSGVMTEAQVDYVVQYVKAYVNQSSSQNFWGLLPTDIGPTLERASGHTHRPRLKNDGIEIIPMSTDCCQL